MLQKKNKLNWAFRSFFLIILFIRSTLGLAFTTDNRQPIYLKADQAECRQKEGLCIYSGHVEFKQGTNHVDALMLYMYQSDANQITKIVALGKPAHYLTELSKNQKKIDARAETIQFYPLKNLVVLLGKAEIIEEQNRFSGEHIEIDTKNQTIFSKPSKNNVTTIILQQK